MPDLTDELRRVAADAASRANPAAITDVIRRGNRWRRRTIAQRSVGGLTVLGLGAAVFVTGVAHGPAAPASSSGTDGVTTLTETTSSSAGTMTIQVKYRPAARNLTGVRLLSITYSGSAHARPQHPVLVFTLAESGAGRYCPITAKRCSVTLKKRKRGSPAVGVTIVLKLNRSELSHFTGSVPPRRLDHSKPVQASTLTAALGDQVSTHWVQAVSISMQEGLTLG